MSRVGALGGITLVETEAGDVSVFDDVGIITLGLVEGEGEVLDTVGMTICSPVGVSAIAMTSGLIAKKQAEK